MPAATESEMSEAESYCELDEEHTMCKYKDGTGGRCGNQVCSRVFSDQSYKDKIVEKHNKYRREVAEGDVSGIPASSDMEEVEWDDQIARVAQRWADQCHSLTDDPHDQVRSVPGYPQHGFCGQNVFLKSSSSPFPDIAVGEAVASWFNEVDNFDGTEVEDYGEAGHSTGEVDHFTAVVWAHTYAIGCGYVIWKDSSGSVFLAGLDYHQLIVCNYCPGGNYAGEQIFEEGHPGSDCPSGQKSDDGLCVPQKE